MTMGLYKRIFFKDVLISIQISATVFSKGLYVSIGLT